MIGLYTVGVLLACGLLITNPILGFQVHSHAQFGVVRGRVLSPTGKPVAGASVYAKTITPSASGMFPAKTDETGNFFLREVPAGTYRISATKDDTDISYVFFNFSPWIVNMVVRDAQVTRGVTIRLYPNVGTLVGTARDNITGVPLTDARMVISEDANPKRWISVGTRLPNYRFQIIIPDISLRIKVSAPGYEDWYYGRDGIKEHAESLRLQPNTTKELMISLRRIK